MNKPSRTFLIAAGSIVVALLGFLFIRNLIDFPVYYAAGRSLISGRTDLYSPDFALGRVMDYRYPPLFVVALTPLCRLPYFLAAYIWYLLSVLEITGCILIVRRLFPSLRQSMTMCLIVALGVAQYFVMALHYGNAQLLATFLLFAALYYVLKRKDLAAAGLMALAISIKLTPVLLLPYFAVKKRWNLLAAVCVLLVGINAAPSLYFGFRGNSELLRSWYAHVVASQEFHEDNGPINLSLRGQLRRYLSPVDYSQRVDGDVQYPSINLAAVPREQVVRLWAVIAAALFAGMLLFIWREERNRPRSERGDPGNTIPNEHGASLSNELGLMICVMLLAAPLTSKIYFVALLWPVGCLGSFALQGRTQAGKAAKRALVVIALMNSVLPLLPGRSIQRLLLVLGVDFYVTCLVTAALVYCLGSQRSFRERSGEPQTPARSEAKTP